MEFKVEGSRRNRRFIEAVLPSMFRQLGLERSRKAVVIRVADECGDNNGITVDLSEATGCYMVVIKPHRYLKEIGITLAHELVHVKQLASGKLKNNPDGSTFWAGRTYSKKTAYLSMPWEIQAFQQQELILRRAFEE